MLFSALIEMSSVKTKSATVYLGTFARRIADAMIRGVICPLAI